MTKHIARWIGVELAMLPYLSKVYKTDKGLGFYQREKHGILRMYIYAKEPIRTNEVLEIL